MMEPMNSDDKTSDRIAKYFIFSPKVFYLQQTQIINPSQRQLLKPVIRPIRDE